MATKRIKDLTTTATALDLVSSRYGVIDTPEITKKLPGNLLIGSGSGGGSGDNDKVAVESGAVAGFLKDVLVSASDMVTLVPNGNRLMVNVNLDYSSDPKLETMNE